MVRALKQHFLNGVPNYYAVVWCNVQSQLLSNSKQVTRRNMDQFIFALSLI